MLLFALSALDSTDTSAEDRIAVAAGAEGSATLDGSWVLDKQAVDVPPEEPFTSPQPGLVPGVRTPPLPAGNTIVWRTDIKLALDDTQKDLLVIDPVRFRAVASWGRGPDLAAARAAVDALAARPMDADGTPRTIAVADPALAADVPMVRATVGYDGQNLSVTERVAAFPGQQGRPMYVVAADPLFTRLGVDDPRLRPDSAMPPNPIFAHTMLWSSGGAAGVQAVVGAAGVQPERINTADDLRQDASYVATARARDYQLAIAGYLALLAVLTLAIYAQRTAALRRPTDLMLARVGIGRARVRAAGALEFVLLAVLAYAGAVAGVAVLAPLGARLLDDQPLLLPRFTLQLSPTGLAVTATAAVLATITAVALTSRSADAEENAYRDD